MKGSHPRVRPVVHHRQTHQRRVRGVPKVSRRDSRQATLRLGDGRRGWSVTCLFGMFTYQDRLSEPEAVSYTEFKAQVARKNVAEVFARGDTIQGELKKAAPLPTSRTHVPPVHDRAADVRERRPAGGADQQGEADRARDAARAAARRLSTNLLISFGAVAAAGRLLRLDVQAAAGRDGRRAAGRRHAEAGRSRNRARHLRRRRRHRRGRGRDQRGRRLPAEPGEVPTPRRARAEGRAAGRARPAPARRCWRAPPPARPRCRSSAPAPRSSSR